MKLFGKKLGKQKARRKAKARPVKKQKALPKKKVPVKKAKTKKIQMLSLQPWVSEMKDKELRAILIETKKGWFGNPKKKLKKDVMILLRVTEKEALARGTLLAYSRIPKVSKKLEGIRARRAKKQAKESKKQKAKEAAVLAKPVIITLTIPETKRLLADLVETKKGRFGDPEKKLKKAITKRLKVKPDEALKAENLNLYARLEDVQKRLEKLYVQRVKKTEGPKVETKAVGVKVSETKADEIAQLAGPAPTIMISSSPIAAQTKSEVKRPTELLPQATLGSDIIERARGVAKVHEEQKKLEAEEAQRKVKKQVKAMPISLLLLKLTSTISLPFRLAGRAIAYVLEGFFKGVTSILTVILSIPLVFGRVVLKFIGGFMQGVSKRAGGVSPFGWKKKINQLVMYSGVNKTQEEVTGLTIVYGAVLAGVLAAIGFLLLGWDPVFVAIVALVAFGVAWVIVYSFLNLMADKRTDEVEGALPDVLQIVSANISAGMTPYNALWVSARKEFGALAEEIKIAQKETLGGMPFAESLTDMSFRVRSNILQRTIRLLIQGMKAGGALPNILQGIATDIRQMRLLQKEMAANTMSYTLFILFGMLLGAPLLFSVSIQFVDIINKFQPEGIDPASMTSAQASPMMGGMQGFNMLSLGGGSCPKDFDSDGIPDKLEKDMRLNPKNSSDAKSINPETGKTYLEEYRLVAEPIPSSCVTPGYLSTFAMIALFSIAFFGSILIGLIKSGKQSAGLKLAPLLIPTTLGMFWLMSTGMSVFFGSMFGT